MISGASEGLAPNRGLAADLVFDRGGVKAIGMVGAVRALEAAGYRFPRVAGMSAGAIVASLLAAGYAADELRDILQAIEFETLTDRHGFGKTPRIGLIANLFTQLGAYDGDRLLSLIRQLLAARGVRTFADLLLPSALACERHRFRLEIVVSDMSRGTLLMLPEDIRSYGHQPEQLDVGLAVRMSMSIPLFFKPVRWTQSSGEVSLLGDPGLLAALPIWLFDVPGSPRWPTFGLRMVRASSRRPRREIRSPMSLLKAMYFTALETHDTHFVGSHDFARTIAIDALGVGAIDFRVNLDQKDALFASGVAAAEAFLESWDFETYKLHYRGRARAASDEVSPRVDAVLARPARLLQSARIADSLVQSDTGRTTLP